MSHSLYDAFRPFSCLRKVPPGHSNWPDALLFLAKIAVGLGGRTGFIYRIFPVELPSGERERCYMICVLEISDVTAWKYYRGMLLDNESLSVASTTWELVIQYDMLLEYE